MMDNRGFTIKDLLIRLILIIIFIFLLIWLFPMPDLKPLNNQIFLDNVDRMKEVAKSYYTVERLPKEINESKKMTLREMIDEHLILGLTDSNGKECNKDESYIQITKTENEYVIKVYLSCSDRQDYVITHFGCYDICSRECKMLETTTTSAYVYNPTTRGRKTTKRRTTTTFFPVLTTTKHAKIYEYQYVKDECKNEFDKYTCKSGYYLEGSKCIKNGSEVVSVNAKEEKTNVTSTDTKNAKAVVTSNSEKVSAKESTTTSYDTINANVSNKLTDKVLIKTQKVTADTIYSYDVKGAIGKETTTYVTYSSYTSYDIITATKYATTSGWEYVSTLYTYDGNKAFVGENEKLVLYSSESVPACDGCGSTVIMYKYFRYKKVTGGYTYSCDKFPGYSLYDGDKCRKAVSTKKCPDGYKDTGSNCSKTSVTYSCSSYGSDYKLDSSKKTCTKTTTSYSCPSGTEKTSDPKYCTRKVYGCPAGTTESNGKCSKPVYSCPTNTSDKTYTLAGTKCSVRTKKTVYTCPSGTEVTSDPKVCIKKTSHTKYTCEDYPGYTLNGKKCTKTITTQKTTYKCDSGYTLNGTKCYRTVNKKDVIDAEKSYKVSCDTVYKWSTKTSLDGWSYTGNKRQIN